MERQAEIGTFLLTPAEVINGILGNYIIDRNDISKRFCGKKKK